MRESGADATSAVAVAVARAQVLFMTGADEHGQKIAETAERQGMTPKQLCDTYVTKFQARRGDAPPRVRRRLCVGRRLTRWGVARARRS